MKITKTQLKDWNACRDGYEWFLRRFPEGEAEYQDVLNALAENDRTDDAHWLMNHAGPDAQAVLEIEVLAGYKHLFVAGSLVVKKGGSVTAWLRAGRSIVAGEGIKAGEGIRAGWGIEAGRGIEAGEGIVAGEGIRAGRGIEAGWGIEAGEGMGVFAGLCVCVNQWSLYAQVIASAKPKNLISGVWVEPIIEINRKHDNHV